MDCSYLSPFGLIRSAWRCEDDELRFTVEVPCGSTAAVYLPGREPMTLEAGIYEF